jgi:hypothetical protein
VTDQVNSLTHEPPIFQLGLPPGTGAYACTDACLAMIVRHETGKTVTAAQVRAASGNTNPNSGLTPAQALRALSAMGVKGYTYHGGVTAAQVLTATDQGLVLVGVAYSAYPTPQQIELGGKDDMAYTGPHAILVAGRRYWPPAPADATFQVPFQPGWRCWVRDPDHEQGHKPPYDRMLTSWLVRAMSALVGCGGWTQTFMLAKGPIPAKATLDEPMMDTPIDQPDAKGPTLGLKLGRKDPDPSKPRLRLAPYIAKVPAPPAVADWYSKVPAWGMLLNDRIGDCTCAEVGHQIESLSTYGQGSELVVTDADVLTAYEAVSGYNPATGANDNGALVQDVLNYWRKTGVGGHRCLAFAELDAANDTEVKQGVWLFGSLDVGTPIPQSAIDQFNAGQPWDVVANDGGIAGGHSYEMVGYNATGPLFVTWGKVQQATWAWWHKYGAPSGGGEAWAVITPEFIAANGSNPLGASLYTMGQEMAQLTGDPNPIPAPEPNPGPRPVGCLTVAGLVAGGLAVALYTVLRR